MVTPQTATPNPPATMATVLAAAKQLVDVLSRENLALSTPDMAFVRELAPVKQQACRAYEIAWRAFAADEGASSAGDQPLVAELRQVGKRLDTAVVENERRLRAHLTAHKRLLSLMAEAARRSAPGVATYGPAGAVRGGGTAALSISLDRAL